MPSRPDTDRNQGDWAPNTETNPVIHRPYSEPHPLTVTRYDNELHAMVRHVYGYSWRCTCGARGDRFETMREARQGKREHEATHQR